MGNICGKSEPDPFSQPGRVLGTAPPPQPRTAPVPKKVGGPPRTLGSSGGAAVGGSSSGAGEDARRKAAEAAEARAKQNRSGTGKLGTQLDQQRKQTRVNTLKEASEQELQRREADAAAEARSYN